MNNNFGLGLGLKTPDLLGYKRKEEDQGISLQELANKHISDTSSMTKRLSFKNEVNGYDLLKLPSPSPSDLPLFIKFLPLYLYDLDDFKSPLMTWGEIEDTPVRLDNKNYTVRNQFIKIQ